MNLALSPVQRELAARCHAYGARLCSDSQEQLRDQSDKFPIDLYRGLTEFGLLTHLLPEPFGGGGSFLDRVLIAEALGRYSSSAVSLVFVNDVCASILAGGNTNIARQLLSELAHGEVSFAFALTEPDAGSDAGAIATIATEEPPGHYRLDGVKTFTTGARDADYLLVVARTDLTAPPARGTTVLLIPAETPGLQVKVLPKLANRGHASCEVELDSVRVDTAHVVGRPNEGWPLLVRGSLVERLTIAGWLSGLSARAVDDLVAYSLERIQFGQPVFEFQAIQHQLAGLVTAVESIRALCYSCAWKVDAGDDAQTAAAMAKLHATETALQVIAEAMRLYGGVGYLTNRPISRIWREAALAFYAGGTSEVQRNLIARGLRKKSQGRAVASG
jgi:butyryl-CoA dehydrogenase